MTSPPLLASHCVSAQFWFPINALAVRCLQGKPSSKIQVQQAVIIITPRFPCYWLAVASVAGWSMAPPMNWA